MRIMQNTFDFIGISMILVTFLTLISAIIYIYQNGRLLRRIIKSFIAIISKRR